MEQFATAKLPKTMKSKQKHTHLVIRADDKGFTLYSSDGKDDRSAIMYTAWSELSPNFRVLVEGDIDLAFDYYEQALSESEYTPILIIQAPLCFPKIFPSYRSHPRYQKMLRDVGLDNESVAKLKIPPLPF